MDEKKEENKEEEVKPMDLLGRIQLIQKQKEEEKKEEEKRKALN